MQFKILLFSIQIQIPKYTSLTPVYRHIQLLLVASLQALITEGEEVVLNQLL